MSVCLDCFNDGPSRIVSVWPHGTFRSHASRYLELSANTLGSSLPSGLSSLSSLVYFAVCENSLTGSLPEALSTLRQLT